MLKSEYTKMIRFESNHFYFVGKRLFIKQYLDSIKDSINQILDIGSGTGGNIPMLKGYGKVTAIEKNHYARSLSRKNKIKMIKGSIESLPIKNNCFDLVTVFDVLYHQDVKDIILAIKEIKRVLKPKGYLLITDSAFSFLKSQHSIAVFEKRRFTIKQLSAILQDNGFIIKKTSYMYFFLFPIIIIKRKIIDRLFHQEESDLSRINPVINNILILILKIESTISRFINLPFGSSLIILSQKN